MRKFYKFGIIMLFLLPVALPAAFAYNFEGVCVTYTSSDTTFIYDTVCMGYRSLLQCSMTPEEYQQYPYNGLDEISYDSSTNLFTRKWMMINIYEEFYIDSIIWLNYNIWEDSSHYDLSYSHTFLSSIGSDSIVIWYRRILFNDEIFYQIRACGHYIWQGDTLHDIYHQLGEGEVNQIWVAGDTINTSSICYQYYTNTHGCDSVFEWVFDIDPAIYEDIYVTTNDSYIWNGFTYTESGDYTMNTDTIIVQIKDPLYYEIDAETGEYIYFYYSNYGYITSSNEPQLIDTIPACKVITLHLTITVGIEDHNLGASMTVYPNPTNSLVNVECAMNDVQAGTVEFHVFDAYGKLVDVTIAGVSGAQGVCDTPLQTAQIDLSRYAPGIYFIKAVADGNVVAVRKVVKR